MQSAGWSTREINPENSGEKSLPPCHQRSWPNHERSSLWSFCCFVFLMSLYLFLFYLAYIRRMGRAVSLRAVRGNEKAGAECQLSSPYSPLDVLANTLSWDTTWHSGRCQRLLKEKGFGRIYKPFPWEFLFWFLFCLQTKQDFIFLGEGGFKHFLWVCRW